jgi:predicted metal-dependent phosphoesterase TrpH
MKLKTDMHVHSEKSYDSKQTLCEIAAACKASGTNAVCITDHNIFYRGERIIDGIYFYPGIEISTDKGHLLGLFCDSPVEPVPDFDEAVRRIHEAGGLAVLAHPYQSRRRQKSEVDTFIKEVARKLDGIEIQNSRACIHVGSANQFAKEAATDSNLFPTGGSDGHLSCEVGSSYAVIECENTDTESVREAVKLGRISVKGKNSKRIFTAKSQYIKLKKKKSGIKKHAKLWIFAVWCVFADIFKKR